MSEASTDPLAGFEHTTATYDGETRPVFRAGDGPGIVVMSEIPGITPSVAGFARRLVDAGYTVAMPSLFGTPGKERSTGYLLSSLTRACISKEFTAMAVGETSPIVSWLRQLAADLHAECGGPGVGAIGMCLTGGFALPMMVEPAVVAPVLSQPSLPLPFGRRRQGDLGVSPDELATIRARVADEPCPVLAMRFTNDGFVRKSRFDRLEAELGAGLVRVEIDSSPGNPHGIGRAAHSVVTEDLVDEEGHPTRAALDQVLAFFAERLAPAS
ncbi:MAG: dienelactone hydrolase family protein [Actinomycetota bacterium]